jgi:hypothetical protein
MIKNNKVVVSLVLVKIRLIIKPKKITPRKTSIQVLMRGSRMSGKMTERRSWIIAKELRKMDRLRKRVKLLSELDIFLFIFSHSESEPLEDSDSLADLLWFLLLLFFDFDFDLCESPL